jgi:hypothetical protein
MWQPQNVAQYTALKQIGVDTGMAIWRDDGTKDFAEVVAPFREAGIGWYAENIATDFYSAYHRWTPGKVAHWRFDEVKQRYWKKPQDTSVFIREPSLSDPVRLARIRDRLSRVVRAATTYRALYYSLGDEPGIADLAAYWDFDLSAPSIAAMRNWLKEQYGTLDALNRQWGTRFGRWDLVVPMTMQEAVTRSDENFSAWADFKAWMDVAFARAIQAGTDAVHEADPNARSGIEGGQIPGWGGYDYTLLPPTVDVMELYDYGENIDIVRSLSPDTILLSTLFVAGPDAEHRVWRTLLRGSRGLILWDPKHEFAGPDGSLGPRAQSLANAFRKIRGGLGALVIASQPHIDPIAILYSPASFRTQWMIDNKPLGEVWSRRDAEAEYQDNAVRRGRRTFSATIAKLGRQHAFLSPEMLVDGTLSKQRYRVLVLPHTIALSAAEADAIRQFVSGGGTVVADTTPGVFDEHSRRLKYSPLADLFPPNQGALNYGQGRAIRIAGDAEQRSIVDTLTDVLAEADIKQLFPLTLPDGRPPQDVATYVFRNGATTIVALQRNWAKTALATSEAVTLTLPPGSFVTDLMAEKPLGQKDSLEVVLGAVEPAMFAVSPASHSPPEIYVATGLRLGDSTTIHISRTASDTEVRPLHVEIFSPSAGAIPKHFGNVLLTGDAAEWPLTLRPEDQAGTWRIRVTDILAAASQIIKFVVSAQ